MILEWWRRWESNPRPKAFNSRLYMLIRPHCCFGTAFEAGKGTVTKSPRKGLGDALEKPVVTNKSTNVTPESIPWTEPSGRPRLLRS